jgi:hypothetical protein
MEGVDKQTYKFKRCWTHHDIQDLGYRYTNNHGNLLQFDIGTKGDPVQEEVEDDTILPDFHIETAEFRSDWEAPHIHQRLVAFLEEHAGTTTQVDQIICFGLGSPVSSRHPRILRRAYTQHLAACTVRDIFARKQNGPAPRILAQDPCYTTNDIAYLSSHFSTSTLPDPEAFRALTSTIFVISISPEIPVRQIALGMMHDSGGPAGFLCCAIEDYGLEGKSVTMLNGDVITHFTDNSSPRLWEYKQRGVWCEWDDVEGGEVEDCFGRVGWYLKRK